jgi:hypothetical protein
MKKIKVYNIEKLVEQEVENKKLFGFSAGMAIIEGEKGVFAFDNEGVGWEEKDLNAEIKLGITDIPKENQMFVMPQYQIVVKLSELVQAEYKEMELKEFIDRYNYNNRLARNFSIVLEVIDNIGLNSKEYV